LVGTSKRAVYAALFGNLGISIAKLIAALLTNSSAMWSETYHSFSDTFNQVLLLIGIKTSSRVPTERHPFGYGKDNFFGHLLLQPYYLAFLEFYLLKKDLLQFSTLFIKL
jgi:divalent metal cation (Fe/Co/Zn/Cd) transporter